MSSPLLRSQNDFICLARRMLQGYHQSLQHLESICLQLLLQCVGSVAIASTLLAFPAVAQDALEAGAVDADAAGRPSAEQAAESLILSFELERDLRRSEALSEALSEASNSSQIDNQEPLSGALAEVRAISSADGNITIAPALDGKHDAVSSQLISPDLPDNGGNLALSLPEPALVASAPLSLSAPVRRLSRAITPKTHSTTSQPQTANAVSAETTPQAEAFVIPEAWWNQGEKSPIAVAIGAAEGTRYADGGKTNAYYWHRDPGNGADNFGTFSYQHLPPSLTRAVERQSSTVAKREVAAQNQLPEISDREQMKRLRSFHDQLQQQAAARGIVLGQLELLNALDLANQSEAAALLQEGYVDRLAELKAYEDNIEEQILQARSWSYWNPERKSWDAPGLGNTYDYIRQDQHRRMEAIKQALEQYPAAQISHNSKRGNSKDSNGNLSIVHSPHTHPSDQRSNRLSSRLQPRHSQASQAKVKDYSTTFAQASLTSLDEAAADQIILFDLL